MHVDDFFRWNRDRGFACVATLEGLYVEMTAMATGDSRFHAFVTVAHESVLGNALPKHNLQARIIKVKIPARKTLLSAKRMAGRHARRLVLEERKMGYL